jgi:hypothetical protein
MNAIIQNYFVNNWRTTASGLALLVLVALHYAGINVPGLAIPSDPGSQLAMVLAALGLVSAKDGSTTGAAK